MNLTRFLKETDAVTANLTADVLRAFLHETARTLPESQRDFFLQKLQTFQNTVSQNHSKAGTGQSESIHHADNQAKENLYSQVSEIKDALDVIESGDLSLTGTWNEEGGYDDWYSEDGEYGFEDPDHILETIEEACQLAHRCVDLELYREGNELFQRLLALEVCVEGDYADENEESMEWRDLLSYDLVRVDKEAFALEALYACYQALSVEERPQELFWIFEDAGAKELTLEKLLQAGGGELPEWKEFLPLWIRFLGDQTGDRAAKLLEEALLLQDDAACFLETARTFVEHHPQLYLQFLQQALAEEKTAKQRLADQADIAANRSGEKEAERHFSGISGVDLLAVGEEALEKISPGLCIRSRIALLTASCALAQNRQEEAETCWLEAFRSDTGPVSFLRLRIESRDFAKYREKAREIYETLYRESAAQRGSWDPVPSSAALQKNRLNSQNYFALCFFDGAFSLVLSEGMKATKGLGWSGTFMKTGLALFLMYLYRGDTMPAGIMRMCRMAADNLSFEAGEYEKGLLCLAEEENDGLYFWRCFGRWKKQAPMSDGEEAELLSRIDKWIALRTEAIMENNRRNYYGECAAFIAALGEVRESRGERGAKEKQMLHYREQYSRRRAFHEELRRLGMRDSRSRR